MPARRDSKVMRLPKLLESTSPFFILPTQPRAVGHNLNWRKPLATDASKITVGEYARTAPDSGPMLLLRLSMIAMAGYMASARSPGTSRNEKPWRKSYG